MDEFEIEEKDDEIRFPVLMSVSYFCDNHQTDSPSYK